MVTLKAEPGARPFSEIGNFASSGGADVFGTENFAGYLKPNGITRAFVEVITHFGDKWYCIEPITCFIVMPDHIHLILKIENVPDRLSLPKLVWQLRRALDRAYFSVVGGDSGANGARSAARHCLSGDWHHWIVLKRTHLAAFKRYIRENPYRAYIRRAHREYFARKSTVPFLGREWRAYGNLSLLELPVIAPFKGHRSTAEGSDEWNAIMAKAAQIGPGGAGISTFMSPLEKAVREKIGEAGGNWIVLHPEGFAERWHPGREYERFCAEGRVLFLSLYDPLPHKPDKAQMYRRCHEMIDLVAAMDGD